MAQYYGVEKADNCILAPSGTDSVLAALALSLAVNPAVGVVLAGVEETGSGVPLATQGRHFASTTALGFRVRKSEKIAGFPAGTQLVTAPLRTENGELNSRQNIFHICQQQIHNAVQAGQRVLLYLLDTSKTGQLVPDMQVVQALCHTYPGQIDVVVDACQARLMPERIKAYLQQDWAVMVTGSKFYTGPAFCGALLLPETWRQRLDHAVLPSGLAAYFNQAEWPACKATASLNNGFNLGLLLRWVGACAEIERFSHVPASEKTVRLEQFLGGIRHILEQDETIELLPDTLVKRDALPHAWDQQQTIFFFSRKWWGQHWHDPCFKSCGMPAAACVVKTGSFWLSAVWLPRYRVPDYGQRLSAWAACCRTLCAGEGANGGRFKNFCERTPYFWLRHASRHHVSNVSGARDTKCAGCTAKGFPNLALLAVFAESGGQGSVCSARKYSGC